MESHAKTLPQIRNRATRDLIAAHQEEFEALKAKFRPEYPGRRDTVRTRALSVLVEKYHDEFDKLYNQYKIMEGLPQKHGTYLERVKQLYIDGVHSSLMSRHTSNWCDRYALKELRQKHNDEYRLLVEKYRKRGFKRASEKYELATSELRWKYPNEYRTYYAELREQINTLLYNLKMTEKRFKKV